jgi:hypothetical protein
MFSNHVSKLSSAYIHDELSREDTRRVAEHLIACASCRADFDEVKLGAKFADHLNLVPAPASIWNGVVANLDVRPRGSNRFQFLKPLAIAATIVMVIAGGLWLSRKLSSNSALQSWQVARLNGAPRIDAKNINDQDKLAVGQWLETDAASRAQLNIEDVGRVEIDPNTRVRLLQTNPNEHRLELAQGRLSARISAPPKLFFVNTPSGVAQDLGCAYTLEVDDAGNSVLHVTAGWVSMQTAEGEPVVPGGAACATRKNLGPGTPYFEDASEDFRTALAKFDFDAAAESSSSSSSMDVLLREARPRDAMTLWYLLPRVNKNERTRVYDRMTAITSPPAGVTREGMLNLDQAMMNSWKAKLGLSWGQAMEPKHSFWKKLWAETLGRMNGLQGKR